MPRLVIITTSIRRDLDYFIDLHKSVIHHSNDDVEHHVIVPNSDVEVFSNIRSHRLKIFETSMFLPSYFRSAEILRSCVAAASRLRFARHKLSRQTGELLFNMYRPWPPVRGWIIQQLVKLAAIARSEADVVLTADSDVVLIRAISVRDFLQDGVVRFYRKPNSIHSGMARHLNWWRSAHRLLDLSGDNMINAPDYISGIAAWDPSIVRSMQSRISEISGRTWLDTLAGEIDFSELMLHGIYIDRFCDDRSKSFSSPQSRCYSYWENESLRLSGVEKFVEGIRVDDIAMLIQSASNTSIDVRRAAIQAAEQHCKEMVGK